MFRTGRTRSYRRMKELVEYTGVCNFGPVQVVRVALEQVNVIRDDHPDLTSH